jgi:hypothetical protein
MGKCKKAEFAKGLEREKTGWITSLNLGEKAGKLEVKEKDGKPIAVSVAGSSISGEFTRFNGWQTISFENKVGQEWGYLEGDVYVGISKHSDMLDWAFIISDTASMPEWVGVLAQKNREGYSDNIFLAQGRNFVSGRSDIKPLPKEEFGSGMKLLLVGRLKKVNGEWKFQMN